MKLKQVLSVLNQVEKTKFINCLDRICSSDSAYTALSKEQMKGATNDEVTELFKSVEVGFSEFITEQLSMAGPAVSLLVNILSRDGNCVATQDWVKSLYTEEWRTLDLLSKAIEEEIKNASFEEFNHGYRLKVFKACLEVAYFNDKKINRQSQITDDARSILNEMAEHLKISTNEAAAIEHLSNPIEHTNQVVSVALEALREIGLIFINRKTSEVLVPDEFVVILNRRQGKEIADKHLLRILRCLSDAELSSILKRYGKATRGVSRNEKIYSILHSGIKVRSILDNDIFSDKETQNARKDRLKNLMDELDVNAQKLGTTLSERIDIILNSLNSSLNEEFDELSASGYKELHETLLREFKGFDEVGNPEDLDQRLQRVFELEPTERLSTEMLRALSITPNDILFLLSHDEIREVRDTLSLTKRGEPRAVVLQSFVNANDKLIENYELLAARDLQALRSAGLEITEAEIGVKFEEATKTIFENLSLNVDEELRKSINTAKDKIDILISVSNADVIIGEAKTFKNGDFAKYSTTSRQVKSYVSRCESQGKAVIQVLIIAPTFSNDFIESASVDTDINISLLTAAGLKEIYEAYKAKKRPNFSAKLLTKGGLLKTELIAKNI